MAIFDINTGGNMRSTGTPVDNTATIKSRIAGVAPGDVVYFPSGDYYISGNILDRDETNSAISIVGDDVEATTIRLMPSPTSIANAPVFKVAGSSSAALWFQMRHLMLDGNNRSTTAPWIEFTKVANARLEHLLLYGTDGRGLHAKQWRDSVCNFLEFGNIGTSTVAQMTVEDNGGGSTQSQNLVFDACRWENNENRALELIGTIRISFLGCKWHGALPNPTNTVGHVLLDGTYLTSFSGCRFANSLTNMIDGSGGSGLLITGSILNGAQQYGIELTSTDYCGICGNYFQNTSTVSNNIKENSCTGNDIAGNVFEPW